jgi:hypothetical protein
MGVNRWNALLLTEEMAQVEALLNRTMEPKDAEQRSAVMRESLTAIQTEHQVYDVLAR